VTFEVLSPDKSTTLTYDPNALTFYFVDNSTEASSGSVALPTYAGMALFSPDSTMVYAPTPTCWSADRARERCRPSMSPMQHHHRL